MMLSPQRGPVSTAGADDALVPVVPGEEDRLAVLERAEDVAAAAEEREEDVVSPVVEDAAEEANPVEEELTMGLLQMWHDGELLEAVQVLNPRC